ncbi:glycerol-3-phosphate dehydrogenase/oxidase, partial [Microbacteriaceae bacterium K1510]|nr:glycerol-3-phosphate dehydrogenase/oxidase [Microbacteriaceae bacterium K1510]
AYLCQNADGRVVFAIPYEERFTLLGTTEVAYDGDPAAAAISGEEEEYLLALTRQFFARPPLREDIVWSFAGVRPLFDEEGARSASAVSRDYS